MVTLIISIDNWNTKYIIILLNEQREISKYNVDVDIGISVVSRVIKCTFI